MDHYIHVLNFYSVFGWYKIFSKAKNYLQVLGMKYLKSVNHHIKAHFEESKPLYATIPKGWAIETPVIVFTSSPSKFECCILFRTTNNNCVILNYDDFDADLHTQKYNFRKFRKSKAIPVKVSIYPEESVSVEVYAETIGPAQLVLPDFGHISAVTKSSGNVRTLHGILHPVREK